MSTSKEDTLKIFLYENLGQAYRDEKKIDSSIITYKQALDLNQKINYSLLRQTWEMGTIDYLLYQTGNYAKSLEYASQELVISEKLNDIYHLAFVYLLFGHNYKALSDYRQSLNHYFKAKQLFKSYYESINKPEENIYTKQCIGEVYLRMNQPDSALFFARQAYNDAITLSVTKGVLYSERIFGDVFHLKGNDQLALKYYTQYLKDFAKYKENNRDLGFVFNNMAQIYQNKSQIDSAIFYAKKALDNAQVYGDQENMHNAASLLSDFYKERDEHLSYAYFKTASKARDSMMSSEKLRQAQLLSFNEQIREKEKTEADAKEALRDRLIIIITAILVAIISFLIWYRIKQLRLKYKTILEHKEAEKLKEKYEKQLLELEAKALRAQMNPHFIFNCMNSIKSLVQKNEDDKAVTYLTTFSKLIRTIFQNSDKRDITLYDELETCKLYTQLESMRFGNKFSYNFNIDEKIDLKSLFVPALIIQPFIENAIWHGIMPKEDGGYINVSVKQEQDSIVCIIEDDGIGRDISRQNKFKGEPSTHQSKGVHLTQSRLDLDNLLNERKASLEIFDKKDDEGKAIGTTVILNFKEY